MNNSYYPGIKRRPVENFRELLYYNVRENPDKDCYRYLKNNTEYKVSYKEFASVVSGFGATLVSLGINAGKTAVIGDKCHEWIAAYLASIIFGGVAVPLDRELSDEQARDFVNFADCETVVFTSSKKNAFIGHESEMPTVKYYIEISSEEPTEAAAEADAFIPDGNYLDFASLVRFGSNIIQKEGMPEIFNKQDIYKTSIILFTSGTTGTSKGVMLSQRNIISCVNDSIGIVDIRHDDITVSVLPLHHTYEMTADILSAIHVGATVCINDNIKNTTRDLKYFRPTLIALVPLFVTTIYKKIIDQAHKNGLDKALMGLFKTDRMLRRMNLKIGKVLFSKITAVFGGRLTRIVCGGAPLSPDMIEKFASLGITLAEGYGITECSPVIAVNSFSPRMKSCGLVLPGVQIFIDRESASDASGEIVVKGDNIMLGYYKNEAATNEVLDSHGWFRTGDCGYIDDDNYLYITGRKKNVIVLNSGKNIFPEELEESLEAVPLVKECMVAGRKTGVEGGIDIVALIYPDYIKASEEGLDSDEAIADYFNKEIDKLNKKLVHFKRINKTEIRKTPFPKTSTQKIQRFKVI